MDSGYPRLNTIWWLGCPEQSGNLQDGGSDQHLEMEEDSNQFEDIDPESTADDLDNVYSDDLDNVYSGLGHLSAIPFSLVLSLILSHLFRKMI